MIKSKLGHRLDGWVQAVLPFLFKRPVNPNVLTVIGTFVCLLSAGAFALGHFPLAGFLLLLGGAFDLVDGVVARHHGNATRFGAFLDSTLDRLVDMATLLGIAVHYAVQGEPGYVLLAGWALAAAVLVSYAKACAERYVPEITVGFLERGERVAIIAAGALFGVMIPALWVVAIGSTVTVIQRFLRAYQEMERADAAERATLGEQT